MTGVQTCALPIFQHYIDYAHEAIPGRDGVTLAVMRQREAAEEDAKNGNSAATDAALAFQYKLAEEHGDKEHMHSIVVHQAHFERMSHQHHGKSLAQEHFTYFLWSSTYNALSMGIAAMGSSNMFFWLMIGNVAKPFKPALAITGIVTFIATYHYFRIFNSWCDAFKVTNWVDDKSEAKGDYTVEVSGAPFNDAYRYVDWLLTVPLLLIELILVMKLPKDETVSLAWKLGLASAVMVALGYPGEVQDDLTQRWIWWALAMLPFAFVVQTLLAGLNEATDKQPESVKGLVVTARHLTVEIGRAHV